MKFASIAAIINLDNINENALFENKMKESSGKKLKTEFKRYMMNEQSQ